MKGVPLGTGSYSRQMSRAVKDRRQSASMLAFALEGPAHRGERLGQRKDIGGDEHIGVRGSYRMPVDAFRRDGNFGRQISACKCDAFRGETPQRDAADHPVLFPDLVYIQEATELLGLAVSGDGRRQSHPEPFPASALHALPRAQPGPRSSMAVMELGRRTVKADLQRQAISWQGTKRLEPPPCEQHAVGEHRRRRRGGARQPGCRRCLPAERVHHRSRRFR